jgi:glycosyltransferase involved in cell wall biosynthesis
VVVSNAAPLRYLYTEARGYSLKRTRAIEAIECAAARLLHINHVSYLLPQASRVIAFTEFLKHWYVSRRIISEGRIDVVPIFLSAPEPITPTRTPRTIGFIAKDFDAKGGPILLDAFKQVRRRRPDADLVIVGCPPRFSQEEQERNGVRWLPYVPRERLQSEIIPSFDVFAYPTLFDGQPLVVMEALAAGVPVIVSDYQAMPGMVDHGRAGVISPMKDPVALAENILWLLEPNNNARFRRLSLQWYKKTYSAEQVRPRLRQSYELALTMPQRNGDRAKTA